jgi:hypothetical protein
VVGEFLQQPIGPAEIILSTSCLSPARRSSMRISHRGNFQGCRTNCPSTLRVRFVEEGWRAAISSVGLQLCVELEGNERA